jgi:hypothetical protein
MVAGNPGKKVGGRYLQEDLSVFYYCEQRFCKALKQDKRTLVVTLIPCI